MAQLKGGSVADFSGSMAEAIEQALEKEWQAVKGTSLPADEDHARQILFSAIASGILNYLKAHQSEVINTITLDTGAAQTVTALDLNIPQS